MGRPKAWLPFGDEMMLQRLVRLLSEVIQPIVVVAAPGQDLPQLPPDIMIVRDEEKGRGPLQGIAAGMSALQGHAEAAYLSSCDVPFLRPAFVRRMIDLLDDREICVPYIDGYHHPLASVYRIGIVDRVVRLLAENRLRPVFLFETSSTRFVQSHELTDVDPDFRSLRNLNTPEDYEKAVRDLEQGQSL
jgi:molybdenum cofactor guanylyltransferase